MFKLFFILFYSFCFSILKPLFHHSARSLSEYEKIILDLRIDNIRLQKEIEILKRSSKKHPFIDWFDRIFFIVLSQLECFKPHLSSIVHPSAILKWFKILIKKRWTFKPDASSPGRPPVPLDVRKLILQIKLDNPLRGPLFILGELHKLSIYLDEKTIRNVLYQFRKQGKIPSFPSWKVFISSHIRSLFACDFLTVDSLSGSRFYVFFIIHYRTREIIQFAVTKHPTIQFLKNRFYYFEQRLEEMGIAKAYLLHDGSGEFYWFCWKLFHFKHIRISPYSPNMNPVAERFVGTLRRQCLDWFIIFTENQLRNILAEYINYYNSLRPHQGIGLQVPKGYIPQTEGRIVSKPILGGLVHHYYRLSALPA